MASVNPNLWNHNFNSEIQIHLFCAWHPLNMHILIGNINYYHVIILSSILLLTQVLKTNRHTHTNMHILVLSQM